MKVVDCFYTPAYKQVRNEEDGERYDAFCGYNVIAQTDDGKGYFSHHLYTCGLHEHAGYTFDSEAKAHTFVQRVLLAGDIRAEYWANLGQRHVDDLPDYVTDPHRPEFN